MKIIKNSECSETFLFSNEVNNHRTSEYRIKLPYNKGDTSDFNQLSGN